MHSFERVEGMFKFEVIILCFSLAMGGVERGSGILRNKEGIINSQMECDLAVMQTVPFC